MENKEKFLERVDKLTEYARANNNTIDYDEISREFKDELNADQMDKLYSLLESKGIDIVSSENDRDTDLLNDDFSNIDFDKLDSGDDILSDEFSDDKFDDKDQARRFFLELRQLFTDWNYSPYNSDKFKKGEEAIAAKIKERSVNA